MKRRTNRWATIATLFCLAGTAAAQPERDLGLSPERSVRSIEAMAPVNAALVYYQLFLDAKMDTLTEAVEIVRNARDGDARAETGRLHTLLAECGPLLDGFVAAGALPECDFGIRFQDGWLADLPHLGRMRTVALALGADARRLGAEGQLGKAADRIATMYHIARHVRQDPLIIANLVAMAITDEANKAVADLEAMGPIAPQNRARLADAIDRFGRDEPFQTRRAIWMEGVVTVGWLAKTFPDGGVASGLIELGLYDPNISAADRARYDAMTIEDLREQAGLMGNYYRSVLEQWESPDAVAEIRAIELKVAEGEFGMLAQFFAPSLTRTKQRNIEASRELLRTRDRLVENLPDSDD